MQTIKNKLKQIQIVLHDDKEAHKRALELINDIKSKYGLSDSAAVIYVLNKFAIGDNKFAIGDNK